MKNTLRNLIVSSLFAVSSLCAQALVVPQVADGDGWASTVVLTNTTANETSITLAFNKDTTGGATEPWTPTFLEGNPGTWNLPAGSSLFLHTPGTAPSLTQGWAELTGATSGAVVAYVIYTFTSGKNTSQATAQAVTGASRILVPFDNTGNLSTELAVVNPNESDVSISVNFNVDGKVSTGTALALAGGGQTAFSMASQFQTATAGLAGLAEFYTSTGSFAIIALQSNTNPSTKVFSFTTAPVYPQASETPVITASAGGNGGGGGGAIPAGDITYAGFSIGKTTSLGIVSERVGGEFGVYTPQEWEPPYEGTRIAPYCSVYSASYTIGTTYPYTPLTYLDAGKNLSLKGPSLPAADTTLPAMTISGVTGPEYVLQQLPTGTLVDGGTYTLSGPGGTQVDAFNTSATLPSGFSTNLSSLTSVNRSQPPAISWTGSGFETVIIGVIGSTLSGANFTETVLSCAVPASLNSYSIPTAALSHLPATTNGIISVSTAPVLQGPTSPTSGQPTTLTPNLVQGGKIEYGAFTPTYSEVNLIPIQ
jgi:hypothetical protein